MIRFILEFILLFLGAIVCVTVGWLYGGSSHIQ